MCAGVGGGWWGRVIFQFLMLSPNLLKSQIPYVGGGGGGEGGVPNYVRHLVRIWGELQNFDKNCFHLLTPTVSQETNQ